MYTHPSYNGEPLTYSAIQLALNKDNNSFFELIQNVISRVAYQELRRISESKEVDVNNLTPEQLSLYFVPLYAIDLKYYIQKLAGKIANDSNILVSVSNIVRSAMVHNAYLNFQDDNGVLKIKDDNNVIRDITYDDILEVVGLMLQNSDILAKLKEEVRV